MFLSIKEIKDSKLRYGLLTGIIFLIAAVIFFLAGLAGGLAEGFKQGVEDWQATGIILNQEANKIGAASQFLLQDEKQVQAEKKAAISLGSASLSKVGSRKKENVALFGTEEGSFLIPKRLQGKSFTKDNEVLLTQGLAEDLNLKVGDKIHLANLTETLEVVGLIQDTTYTTSPVVYLNLSTLSKIKFGFVPPETKDLRINGIVVKDSSLKNVNLGNLAGEKLTMEDFINNLPGYRQQNLTLNTMVYVLIVIAALVVGIFMYVLTMQKKQLFGILKAQGVKTRIIADSILWQSLMLALLGTLLSFVTVFGISFILPNGLPFTFDVLSWSIYGGLLVFIATIGGLFSVPSIKKIDPIIAIGG